MEEAKFPLKKKEDLKNILVLQSRMAAGQNESGLMGKLFLQAVTKPISLNASAAPHNLMAAFYSSKNSSSGLMGKNYRVL